MGISVVTGLDYLIPDLRLHLGDTNPSTYRYMDEWLRVALVAAVKELQRWWKSKYLIDTSTYQVSRNPNIDFEFDSPPIIQTLDERPIILMASIWVKSGSLEANSWSAGSWRDAEFSVSNIEGARAKEFSLKKDWEELSSLIKPPTSQLSYAIRNRIYGADETN